MTGCTSSLALGAVAGKFLMLLSWLSNTSCGTTAHSIRELDGVKVYIIHAMFLAVLGTHPVFHNAEPDFPMQHCRTREAVRKRSM